MRDDPVSLAGAATPDPERRFDLVERMRFEAEGIADLDHHLDRLAGSAAALDFSFNRHDARNALQAATFRLRAPSLVVLRLARGGAVAIEAGPLPPQPVQPVEVALIPLPLPSGDVRLQHDTSDRDVVEGARASAGTFELGFVDAEGFVTRGGFSDLFVEQSGTLLTPSLRGTGMAGVLRARLIAEGKAREVELRPRDLDAGLWIGNAVIGLIAARVSNRSAGLSEQVENKELST